MPGVRLSCSLVFSSDVLDDDSMAQLHMPQVLTTLSFARAVRFNVVTDLLLVDLVSTRNKAGLAEGLVLAWLPPCSQVLFSKEQKMAVAT